MEDLGLINLRWAYALMDGFAAAGVRALVLSPGARSTPLVLAANQHPNLTTWVHLDERGAAFQALGFARGSGEPVALVATSGSAPAHWFPAVLEADQSRVPLILLSANRPPELQDWGANQTLDQGHLFGIHVRAFFQAGVPEDRDALRRQMHRLGIKAVERAIWPCPGPVHIDLPFREPLTPRAPPDTWPRTATPPRAIHRPRLEPYPSQLQYLLQEIARGFGLIVCGPGPDSDAFAQALARLADRLGAPIFGDPLSGLRFGPWPKTWLLTRYTRFLPQTPHLPEPRWILRFGRTPVSKALLQYLSAREAPQVLVDPGNGWADPSHRADRVLRADPERLCRQLLREIREPRSMREGARFLEAEARFRPDFVRDETPDHRPGAHRLIPELLEALPEGAWLLSGNSLAIRFLDAWSGSGEKRLHIRCNRGTSGIEGTVSTFLGLARARKEPLVALLGDLTLAHDLNGLLGAEGLRGVLIVLDNGGGGIFETLPQAHLPGFRRYWYSPLNLDWATVARLFHLGFHRVRRQSQFLPALERALGAEGVQLIAVSMGERAI